eukprot:2856100-Heterocapsa_arctica.AAC.1
MGNLTLQHSDSGAPLCGSVSGRETKAIIQIISAGNKGTSQHSLEHTEAGKNAKIKAYCSCATGRDHCIFAEAMITNSK